MELVKEFDTTQCHVSVYKTNYRAKKHDIYCIVSVHNKDGKENVRFGTLEQIQGIAKTYRQVRKGAFLL